MVKLKHKQTGRIVILDGYEIETDKEPQPPTFDKDIDALFHKLWTKAGNQPDYDKSDWKQLVRLLYSRGIVV